LPPTPKEASKEVEKEEEGDEVDDDAPLSADELAGEFEAMTESEQQKFVLAIAQKAGLDPSQIPGIIL
jgi:hypothetical protein